MDSDFVINQLFQDQKESNKIAGILLAKKKWNLSKKVNFSYAMVLPSKLNEYYADLLKEVEKGFTVFIYSESSALDLTSAIQKHGYVLSSSSLDELPMEAELQNEILEFISTFKWMGSVIFFAHDGFPIYILDSAQL